MKKAKTSFKEKMCDFLFYLTFPTLWFKVSGFNEAMRKAQIKQIARDIYDITKEVKKLKEAKGVD